MSDYKPKKERIKTDVKSRHKGTKISPEKKKAIEDKLKAGDGIVATAKAVGSSEHTVSAIKNGMTTGIELNAWKNGHRTNLMAAAQMMGERLITEIPNLSANQLPLAIAIITDKALALNDQPTTITEQRLRISHEDLDKMLRGEVIDVTPDQDSVEKNVTKLGNIRIVSGQ